MTYQTIPGRTRALCCVCGTCRTVSVRYWPRRHVPEGMSYEQIEQGRARTGYPGEWVQPWHRVLGDLKCVTCGQTTQHARLRDHDAERGRDYAERVNYGGA